MNIQERVHYYSPYDMSIPLNWQGAEVVINNYKNGWRTQDVCDVVELYNIFLFVENDVAKKDWTEDVLQLIRSSFKKEVVGFFSSLKRDNWVTVLRQLDYDYKPHFGQFWTGLILKVFWILLVSGRLLMGVVGNFGICCDESDWWQIIRLRWLSCLRRMSIQQSGCCRSMSKKTQTADMRGFISRSHCLFRKRRISFPAI